jgi:hypothetical protein
MPGGQSKGEDKMITASYSIRPASKHRTAIKLQVLGILVVAASPALFADTITPYGVNDSGLIVGQDYTTQGTYQAFVYNPATQAYTFLTPPGATNSNAVGINDSGQIVGSYGNSSGNYGFLYSGGNYTTLNVPGAVQVSPSSFFSGTGTTATGISDNGEIVGSWDSSGTNYGYTYSAGSFLNTGITFDSSAFTTLYGVNDSGLVSGYSASGSSRPSFLYDGSTFTPISFPGASGTVVQGINDSGEAVGFYTLNGQTSGFTYVDGTYTSIMYPGANSTSLFGISNNGEIVGDYSCTSGGCPSDPAFYAIPTLNGYSFTTVDPPAPEPGTILLVGGVLALGATRRWIFNRR